VIIRRFVSFDADAILAIRARQPADAAARVLTGRLVDLALRRGVG
jgi:hypothetical protein